MRARFLVVFFVLFGTASGSLLADMRYPGDWPWTKRRSPSVDRQLTVPQMAAVPPPNAWRVQIEVNKDVTKPRLILPRGALEHVMASQETKKDTVGERPQKWVLFLAIALTGVGLSLLRGRTRIVFAASLVVVVGVSLGFNRDRLEAAPTETVKKVRLGELLLEDIDIIVKPDQDAVTLMLPTSLLPRLRPNTSALHK